MCKTGFCFIGRDTADVLIKERGDIGEHMVVMRTAAVPAFPESRCTEIDPSLTTGERSLRKHSVTDIAFAHGTERMHNEFITEYTEIEMPIGRFDLTDQTVEKIQSCPTLCDPRDSSPLGCPVPGILQARTLEWVAISFTNA